jgi:hypothetical protein
MKIIGVLAAVFQRLRRHTQDCIWKLTKVSLLYRSYVRADGRCRFTCIFRLDRQQDGHIVSLGAGPIGAMAVGAAKFKLALPK